MKPLQFHSALASSSQSSAAQRLVSVSAVLVSNSRLDDGSRLLMLPDRWGVALQWCGRIRKLATGGIL